MIQPSITVVTAVIGPQTDPLQPPVYGAPGVPYLCFTDQAPETIPAPWQARPIVTPPDIVQHVDVARWLKILMHDHVPQADIIVWQDAAYRLAVDPAIFVPLLTRADVLVLTHPYRSTIEQEAEELIRLQLAPHARAQAQEYRVKTFPPSWPLSSTGLLVRRNDAHVRAFARAWYKELQTWEHPRDQMSFDYVAWSTGVIVQRLEGSYRSNPYADWTYTRTCTRRGT